MLADLYGCEVKTAANREGPALGVAILAMVGTGEYASVPEACRAIIKADKVQAPIAENSEKYAPFYKLYTELYPALKESYSKLANL